MTGGSTLIQTVDGTIDLNGVEGRYATSTGNFLTGVKLLVVRESLHGKWLHQYHWARERY